MLKTAELLTAAESFRREQFEILGKWLSLAQVFLIFAKFEQAFGKEALEREVKRLCEEGSQAEGQTTEVIGNRC